jgi:predicted secreted protein
MDADGNVSVLRRHLLAPLTKEFIMAFVHGKSSVFKVDNAAGTLTDISTYVKDCSLAESIDVPETSTFGSSAKTFLTGLYTGTFSISGLFDPTANTVLSGIVAASESKSIEYGPAGSTAGNPKFTAEAIMTSYSITGDVADAVQFSAEFQITGAVTLGTY